jgi:spore coat polysaccharide biosynthesis predicted glycosyltransferase SpsG
MSDGGCAIDVVVAGGPDIGFGHLMRSGTIAAEAIRLGWQVRLHLEGDRRAAEKLAEAAGSDAIFEWSRWPDSRAGGMLMIDIPGDKSEWLERAEAAGMPAIVLDDDRHRDRARLTICPSLHARPTESARRIAGPRYVVLSRTHLETPSPPLAARNELLLSLGGSDPHRATLRVAPWIARLLDDPTIDHGLVTRHVVLGPGFRDPDFRAAGALRDAGWQVHRALSQAAMAQRMAAARLAIIGFGTSLGELAWLGTPHLSITHHASDDRHARRLEAYGIGLHLGYAPELAADTVLPKLRRGLVDRDWQCIGAERAASLLEGGLGARRIVAQLEQIARSRGFDRLRPGTAADPRPPDDDEPIPIPPTG